MGYPHYSVDCHEHWRHVTNANIIDAAHIERQREFSLRTFGPGQRTAGVLDHIAKELDEVRKAPTDLSEWADISDRAPARPAGSGDRSRHRTDRRVRDVPAAPRSCTMSTSSTNPTNRAWLHKLLHGQPHQIIPNRFGGAYLQRWYLIPRNPVLNVYLHQFLSSDDDRALHDHPWWFVSLMLRGQYDEVTDRGVRRRRAGSIAFRRAEHRHRVVLLPMTGRQRNAAGISDRALDQLWRSTGRLPEQPCWTLIITGRRGRTWGFWCKRPIDPWVATIEHVERFVPWDEFEAAGGCGEFA